MEVIKCSMQSLPGRNRRIIRYISVTALCGILTVVNYIVIRYCNVGSLKYLIFPRTYRIIAWDPIPAWINPNEVIANCEYPRCSFTDIKSGIDESDAVFFYCPAHTGVLPSKQNGQIWIFMCWESPKNTRTFKHLNGKINWTWSFRRDSDIIGTYGTFRKSQNMTENDIFIKNSSVAWFVSNCFSKSRRLEYVAMLREYISVDVYGMCGDMTCNASTHECSGLLESTYNFYLSFENSFCRDYLTEKVLTRIGDSVIPVVRGGSDYSIFLPPNSYIDAGKYPSIESLSDDMLSIISNESAYNTFHEWRPYFDPVDTSRRGVCEICKRLHFQDKYSRVYENFEEWWSGNDERRFCSEPDDLK